MSMTRAEHLAWAKKRALEYVDAGDTNGALASITSDLRKHPDTAGHVGITLGAMLKLVATGGMDTPEAVRSHIEGFN